MQTGAVPKQLQSHALQPGERPIGRAKGTPNKLTVSVKEAVERAFERLGGASYLEHVGRTDPRTFCALLSKLLPTKLANADGSPLLAALTELTDAQLEARTARALADAQRAGLMAKPVDAIEVQAVPVPADSPDSPVPADSPDSPDSSVPVDSPDSSVPVDSPDSV
jgi:hypothetical protein